MCLCRLVADKVISLQVEWLVHSRPLDLADYGGRVRLLSDGRQLQISGALVTDSARFTCITANDAGVADRDFDLDVLGLSLDLLWITYSSVA